MAYTIASRSQELASPAAKLTKSPPTHFFRDLPAELWDGLLVKVFDVSTTAPQTLLNLACVDTWLAQRLRNTETNGLWQNLWDIYSSQETYYATVRKKKQLEKEMQKAHELMPNVSQPARESLRLAGFKGCILCGDDRDHIFWRLLVHCCSKCLHSNLLSQQQLWDNFALPAACFKETPYHDVGRRNHKVKSYLYGDVLPILQKYYSVNSFYDFRRQYNVEDLKSQYRLRRGEVIAERVAQAEQTLGLI